MIAVVEYIGNPIPAPVTEHGRKDVAVVGPFQALRVSLVQIHSLLQ